MIKPKIKPLSGKALARDIESLRKLCGDAKPVSMEEVRRILSKCGSLSGGIIKQRRGGAMWDDLKRKVKESNNDEWVGYMLGMMEEIEREYGIE